ncbi:MAG: prepilin-type N-terminal cleavage/methylation domain-containing protein [Rickettsiales bacterium]
MYTSRRTDGFTLVELSIVIIIIALLAGGVVAGQSLLKASDNRTVYTKATEYISAINQFSEKYQGLPGDLYNATSIWGAQHATPATCQTTASSSKLTCDGDGDGHIGDNAATYYENFRAWQQLQNAGMVEGNYNGISNGAASTNVAQIDTNVPSSSVIGAGYSLLYLNSGAANVYSNTGHMLYFGGETADITRGAVLTTRDAWAIDKKVDDGEPGLGKVFVNDTGLLANCATTNSASTANYDLTNTTSSACNMIFVIGQ